MKYSFNIMFYNNSYKINHLLSYCKGLLDSRYMQLNISLLLLEKSINQDKFHSSLYLARLNSCDYVPVEKKRKYNYIIIIEYNIGRILWQNTAVIYCSK